MKKILTVAVASLIGGSVQAATQDPNHMISFDLDSIVQGTLNYDSSKVRGQKSDNDFQVQLDFNYAYTLPQLRNLQPGFRFEYSKGTEGGRGDFEDYGAEIGGYWNFQIPGQELDLRNSYYTSVFFGYGWANTYTTGTEDDELFRSTFALGKRIDLSNWGIGSVSYTPEIAFQSINSKTGGALEYSQSLQFRFLQFSVLF